jgi:hypothetical protein
MLKRFGNIITCFTIALLLLLNGTSHEFIHTFAGHTDTVDCVHDHHDPYHTAFEQQHHHCDFLDLPAPVFIKSSFSFYLFAPVIHNDYFVLAGQEFISREIRHTALRGPPAAC